MQRAIRIPPIRSIPAYVQQHAEESADLRQLRSALVRAPHMKLPDLQRMDNRLAGHFQGLAAAGKDGTAYCTHALGHAGAGTVFAAAVNAIENRDEAVLNSLYDIADTAVGAWRGIVSAFGWVSAQCLQGLVRPLLASATPQRRQIGIAACRLHQVDPGPALAVALRDGPTPLRVEALRAAGSLGRLDLLDVLNAALRNEAVAVEAARALCLLGQHEVALPVLEAHALGDGPDENCTRLVALALLLWAGELERGRYLVRSMARSTSRHVNRERLVIRAMGLLGDTQWVPWLLERMTDDFHARLAGESFSMITGVDIVGQSLDRTPLENPSGSPNDDPEDENVALDEDESLPWPDHKRAQHWWDAHGPTLHMHKQCFAGAPASVSHCEQMLRYGLQRQRIAAAHYLCILQPGRKLFNCAAPAWRQARLLADIQ